VGSYRYRNIRVSRQSSVVTQRRFLTSDKTTEEIFKK
jgi:hypothetical protein